jgi:hypothetical protein
MQKSQLLNNNYRFSDLVFVSQQCQISGWANSNVGWFSDSVTLTSIGFRALTATYTVLYLIGSSYLEICSSPSAQLQSTTVIWLVIRC